MHKNEKIILDEVLGLFLKKEYYSAYNLLFQELIKNPQNQKVQLFLAAFAFATGNQELAQFYVNKMGFERFNDLLKESNEELLKIMMLNYTEHSKWNNYRRPRNTNELNRFGVTAPFCSGNVLEVGCANGDLSTVISMHADNIYGLDIDPIAIELARYKAYKFGLDNCFFALGDGANLSFSDNSFDTVLLAEVLEHVPDPRPFIREAVRVCKSGGKVLISVPKGYSIPDPDHVRIFTKESLEKLIKEITGFNVNWVNEVPSPWLFCYIDVSKVNVESNNINQYQFIPIHTLSQLNYNEKVSIIIPTYNRSNLLEASLDSVLSQTYPNKEIIVVNDGSNDETDLILNKYKNDIIYVYKENGGKSSAINLGLEKASGEYIWVFDDDDIALPKKLEVQIRKFQQDKSIDMIHTSAIYFNESKDNKFFTGMWNCQEVGRYALREQLKGNHFFTPSVIVRSKCYEKVGKWDETLIRAQDYDMWIRISRYFKIASLPIPTIHYRTHSGKRGSKEEIIEVKDLKDATMKYHRLVVKKTHEIPIEEIYLLDDSKKNESIYIESLLERAYIMLQNNLLNECLFDINDAKNVAIDCGVQFINFSSRGTQIIIKLTEHLNKLGSFRYVNDISYFLQMFKKANNF